MDTAELEALLEECRNLGGDHSTCEVKKSQHGFPHTLWESISALANAQGGWIILGVDEKRDFRIVGVDAPAQIESQLAAVCSEMEPPVRSEIATVQVDDRSVITSYIPPIPRDQRPCYKRNLGPYAGSRIRVADGDRKFTDYEVSVLLSNRTEPRHDTAPIPTASPSDMNQELLSSFLRRVRDTKGEIFRRVDDERALTMLNVLRSHEGRIVPTLAGLLAFGEYPQTYEPQLDLTFVAYPTSEPGILGAVGERFTENRAIDGPIPTMVSECIRVLKRNMKRRSIVTGIYRVDEWEYPEEVLREALVNALVHRDYSEHARGMQVQVEMYPDRLVIRNPGGLYGPVEVSSLGTSTVSSSRNKALLKILEDTPYGDGHMVCENRGSGITRIRVALIEAGMEPPRFLDDIASFTAEFPNHTLLDEEALTWLQSLDNLPLTRSQMTALVTMRNGAIMTNSAYRMATGIQDSRAATRELKELVDRHLIELQGTRGAATYHLAGTLPSQGEFSVNEPEESEEIRHAEPPEDIRLSPLQQQVLNAIGREEVSRSEIEGRTGLAQHQVIAALQSLREKGQVTMIGRPRSKNAKWRASN
ncbi:MULTISPECIES: ATP-binding protein [Streptomyces]|jgi:ATP-dependent DNA helicase RecG|uniref:DNA binding domain-containing protein n=1 Tax=Streptomyces spinosisporus TaxID=2927582 RepID=A0ABS9XGF3_9ACTN|nr:MULTISPECIES: ATP-binding protein [Streptomyces]MCI3241172.1 putative DNA binding domain-containing protein [Streptomyces spinosisporus]WUB36577.1 putative DNA binding domain-containing protein [Streptomyces sp. NBC_00588]